MPAHDGLNLRALALAAGDVEALLRVEAEEWLEEIAPIRDFYASLGDSLPAELWRQLDALQRQLRESRVRAA